MSTPAKTLRRRCAWGDPPHPMDGGGPILPGELVSDGICPEHLSAFFGPVVVLPGASWTDNDPDGDYLRP